MCEASENANGTRNMKAIGTACEDCYKFYQQALAGEFDSWDDMAAKRRKDKAVASQLSLAKAVWSGARERAFSASEVYSRRCVGVQVHRHLIVANASELRALLGVPRLLKSHTKDLRTLEMPLEGRPEESETLYVFDDPSKRFRTATLTTSADVTSQATDMTFAQSCYKEQPPFYMGRSWSKDESGAAKLLGQRFPSVDAFLKSHGVKRRSARSDGDDDDEDDGGAAGSSDASEHESGAGDAEASEAALVGIAASSADASSLVSPAKPRPPVPSFSRGGPMSGKKTAPKRRGGILGMASRLAAERSARTVDEEGTTSDGDDGESGSGDNDEGDQEECGGEWSLGASGTTRATSNEDGGVSCGVASADTFGCKRCLCVRRLVGPCFYPRVICIGLQLVVLNPK